MRDEPVVLRAKSFFHRAAVHRIGDVVVKESAPWSSTVNALLRHLEHVEFEGAPRLHADGFDGEGRQALLFLEGDFLDAGMWSLDASHRIGVLVRRLHDATASFSPPADAVWYPWFGRDLGGPDRIIGHCDIAPWNILHHNGSPFALIDWDFSGPVDPLIDLAQSCWLNAKLHNDVVAEHERLPSVQERASHLSAILDGYGLGHTDREGFVDRVIEVAVHAAADEADQAEVRLDSDFDRMDPSLIWALAWRARDASWLMRNRGVLESAL